MKEMEGREESAPTMIILVQHKWSTDLEEGRRWGWRQDGDDICEEDMDEDEDDGLDVTPGERRCLSLAPAC